MSKKVTRRQALLGLSSTVLLPVACSHTATTQVRSNSIFAHGVASGDPDNSSVVTWTRVSGSEGPVAVDWYVATDADFRNIVVRGQYTANKTRDHTVKIVVDDLDPGHEYFYEFKDRGSLAMHAQHPLIVIWDDHETANNPWTGGAENHQPEEGSWAARRAASLRAYYEWLPVREPLDSSAPEKYWRHYKFGDLASLITLESRHTGRRWRLIGNQSVMAKSIFPKLDEPLFDRLRSELDDAGKSMPADLTRLGELELPGDLDSWEGYPVARERFYQIARDAGARDLLVLSGDSHSYWANALYDDCDRPMGVELGATGISAPRSLLSLGGEASSVSTNSTQQTTKASYGPMAGIAASSACKSITMADTRIL